MRKFIFVHQSETLEENAVWWLYGNGIKLVGLNAAELADLSAAAFSALCDQHVAPRSERLSLLEAERDALLAADEPTISPPIFSFAPDPPKPFRMKEYLKDMEERS